jgi:hypothetical protein
MSKRTTIFIVFALSLIIFPALVATVHAQTPADLGIGAANNIGLPNTANDPKDAAVTIVRYLMTFLGIIAVIVILWGGFQWLTAGGNEDKVAGAKKTLIAGIIGLIIIIAAFAIVQLIVSTATNLIGGGA